MKNNDDIHSTDTNEIKHLINRVKQGGLDQGDALLIEKLLSILHIGELDVAGFREAVPYDRVL